MVAQPAGVDGGGDEAVPQVEHGQQRGLGGGIPEVVNKRTLGHGGAGGGFDGVDFNLAAVDLIPDEGEGQPAEVAAAADAAGDNVGVFPDSGQLLLRLQADYRLVQQHVIEHAAQRVAGVLRVEAVLDGLADGDAQVAAAGGIFLQHLPAELGVRAGAGHAFGAPGLHHQAAV